MKYMVVEDTTGRIVSWGRCGPGMTWDQPGQTLYETDLPWLGNHYYLGGVLYERTPLPAAWNKTTVTADGVDEALLTGLPNPCTVYVDGTPYEVTDTQFELSATTPGEYEVYIDELVYTFASWVITAV